jgi:hypothetical protein
MPTSDADRPGPRRRTSREQAVTRFGSGWGRAARHLATPPREWRIRRRPAKAVPRRLSEGDLVADPRPRRGQASQPDPAPVGNRDLVPKIEIGAARSRRATPRSRRRPTSRLRRPRSARPPNPTQLPLSPATSNSGLLARECCFARRAAASADGRHLRASAPHNLLNQAITTARVCIRSSPRRPQPLFGALTRSHGSGER